MLNLLWGEIVFPIKGLTPSLTASARLASSSVFLSMLGAVPDVPLVMTLPPGNNLTVVSGGIDEWADRDHIVGNLSGWCWRVYGNRLVLSSEGLSLVVSLVLTGLIGHSQFVTLLCSLLP